MKTSTLLASPLLLVVLAMPWASALPTQDPLHPQTLDLDLDNIELDTVFLPEELHNIDPSVLRQLFPELLHEALQVLLTVDPEVVLELVRRHQEESTSEEELVQEEQEEGHQRNKRQTTLGTSFSSSRNPFGRQDSASVSLGREWGNGHSLSTNLAANRQTINGFGSRTGFQSGVNYNYRPNDRTSFGFGAHTNGRSHGFGLNFSHRFRR